VKEETMQSRRSCALVLGLIAAGVLFLALAFLGVRYLSKANRDAARPSIQVISPGLNQTASIQSEILVQAKATARGSQVKLLQFYADGFLAGEQGGPAESVTGTWDWTPSTKGIHTLSFLAYNQEDDANVTSMKVTVLPTADRDADGVPDAQDNCPDQAGPAGSLGCSLADDRDQDGLPDAQDACPDQIGDVEDQGCPPASVPDRDRDGIPDIEDRCPDQPGLVEWMGCPAGAWVIDGDGDGLPDFLDTCPDQAGTVEGGGCPAVLSQDSDGDGVADETDNCDDQPGPPDNAGCPVTDDRDGDGVPDARDDCPDVAGLEEFHGCLPDGWDTDEDGDGVMDFLDRCDTQPGPPENLGCPLPEDRDGDGLPDADDNCPDRAGPASNRGCPSIPTPLTDILLGRYLIPEFINPCDLDPLSCDLDMDGLVGGEDDCPGEAGPRERRGCPVFPRDQDGDGVLDEYDECDTEFGEPANLGCPDTHDSDGDGLAYEFDACPDQAGPSDNQGCPRLGYETDVEVELLALNTNAGWIGTYCYFKGTGIPVMVRVPENGLLESIGTDSWNLPDDRRRNTSSITEDSVLTVEVLCWGQPGDPSLFPQPLGTIIRTHGFEAWDNQLRHALGSGGGGWFEIIYRMCRHSC
jgi:hypothetical protein